jgi:arsenate reductase (thioredoxin)
MKPKVLFLCTGNTARSQMAEALLQHHAGDHFDAHSAGLEPGEIHPLTRRVMQEMDLDLAGQYAKDVTEYLGEVHFAYLITVCDRAEERCPTVFPGVGRRLHWSIPDPAAAEGTEEEKLAAFRAAREEVAWRIRAWLIDLGITTGTVS